MDFRWFNLFLGVLCIEGYLAFSPISEESLDDEWVQFNELLSDPSYRLPTTTRPSRYEVTLTPYLETAPANALPFTFDGQVAITIVATQNNVNEIVLHCNDLMISQLTVTQVGSTANLATNTAFNCEMPWSFLKINLTQTLNPTQQYTIRSTFKGNLNNGMRGFYRSWYIDSSSTRRWMATTQFQPGHARQAFPCYDEPQFKARFDITIIRESDFSPSLSNMPIRTTTTLANGRVSETFYTTALTSSYLVGFIVSHYKAVAKGPNSDRPFYIYARDNAGSTGDWALEVGEKLLSTMESYTQYPYYNMTNNIIMQQVAIPDFSAGAMENWGLLTYREALILYDSSRSTHFYKQRVVNIVAHEITHQWFGNLVTCAWWDNLWLNEGFARFYTYYLSEMTIPGLGFDVRFIVEQVQVSLLSDSVDSAHALTNPAVNDPSTVSAHFSTITYAKGASVLRMTQHLLGDSTYRKGLVNYLRENAWSVAEPKNLFNALDEAAGADRALSAYNGLTVEQYMKTWTEQAGHPLVTVSVNHTSGRMVITQERFNVNTGVSAHNSLWHVPITWTRGGAIDFTNLKPTQFLSNSADVINRGTTGREWVIFNKQQAGFYRVNYDSTTWSLITQALRNNITRLRIHEYNRAQIVDDVFIMARAGIHTYNGALNILSFLEFEDQYAPWIAAIAGLNYSRRRVAHSDSVVAEFETLIHKLSTAVTRRLGFAEVPNESFMDGLLRMNVNTFLCNVGHQQCIEAARTSFTNWRNNNTFIPANMRPWVYCTGLRHGTAADFTFFWNHFLAETLASEQVVMLTAAGCTRDASSLQTYLNAITAGPNDYTIRNQDQSTALNSALTSNDDSPMRAFEWLKANVNRIVSALGSINSPLNTITSRLLNENQINEVRTWLDLNRNVIGASAYNTGISGINTSLNNLQWFVRREPEYRKYFETGYIEEVFTTSTTTLRPTTTTTTTTTRTTTVPGGSANIATFSFVTLFATVAFNLA